ncbi:addiction module toxin, HicA family [Marinomonas agarivorans]|nr:addiction module toxin, HicA family [Marinomonas agarivorans]
MKSKDAVRMIKEDGWYLVRTNGSHHIFKHHSKQGRVIVPHPKADLPIGTYKSILKQAGL